MYAFRARCSHYRQFSKMSDRQVILWETGGMSSLETTVLDSSAGNLMPYFSDGNDVLFIAGKG